MGTTKTHRAISHHLILYCVSLLMLVTFGMLFGYCVKLNEELIEELIDLRRRVSIMENSPGSKTPAVSTNIPVLKREKRAVLHVDPAQTFTVNLAQLMELRGPPGRDGRNGTDGRDGLNGRNGTDGRDGLNGRNGTDGRDGLNGRDGIGGRDGLNGRDGTDGRDGLDGHNGADGRDGLNGRNGTDGRDGLNGQNGTDGEAGMEGQNGRNGTDGKSGVNYIRWGKQTCPGDASLLMEGVMAGTKYDLEGGGAEYLCLPSSPQNMSNWTPPSLTLLSRLSSVEFDAPSVSAFSTDLGNDNPGCAICEVSTRNQQVMLPAGYSCPTGWTREYYGYLMTAPGTSLSHTSGRNPRKTAQFVCVDRYTDSLTGAGYSQNGNGALLSHVVADCRSNDHQSLHHCPPYVGDKLLYCVVCTK